MRWEYCQLVWEIQPTLDGSPKHWTYPSTYTILREGEEVGHLPMKHGRDIDRGTLFNDLGREGWEMVSETVRSTYYAAEFDRKLEMGVAKKVVWMFKRPVRDEQPG
jgi:hypothetical protein